MKRARVLCGTGLALIAVCCRQDRAAAQELVNRCFEVVHGEWSPALELGEDSIYLGLPTRVRFTHDPPTFWRMGEAFQLEVARGALPSIHRVRQWRTSEAGIAVVWSNGFSGVQGTFEPGEEAMEGKLRTFWDFSRESQTSDAQLIPIPCSAPHEPDRIAQRYLPRFIELADGYRVELGAQISELRGFEADPGGRRRSIRGAEVFGVPNAPEVSVTAAEDGIIRQIRVQFPDNAAFEEVLAKLVEALGPGIQDVPYQRESQRDWRQSWYNRDTQISLLRARLVAGGWLYEFMLYDPSVWRN